jgi:hypothetical protein
MEHQDLSQNISPDNHKRHMHMSRFVLFVMLLFTALIILGYLVSTQKSDEGIACTADAKLCPDGSYVGRVGPNCEFAECPGE